MACHSHVQIPNTILKHFQDEADPEKKVWYLDIESQKIERASSKRLGTAKGFYSNDMEKYLSRSIEGPIGELNKKVLDFCTGKKESIKIHPTEMDIVKSYIISATARSNRSFEFVNTLISSKDCTTQQLHDVQAIIGMIVAEKNAYSLDFEKMAATVIANRTDRFFVVPRNCYYCVLRDGYPNYIMPISPRGALLLMPKAQLDKTIGKYGVVDNPEQIVRLNKHALKYECFANGGFIASNNRFELECLQECL